MIGDSWEADILGARQSGLDQLWFNPENKSANGFEPTFVVRSLTQIKELL
jgi:putative hydrolase of the HAD superfamily